MLYLALIPLLAIPGVLAGPLQRDSVVERADARTETNHQIFLDSSTGDKTKADPRYALAYTSDDCSGDPILEDGYNMEDRGYISEPLVKSWKPGKDIYTKSGTFCLQKYKEVTDAENGRCIDSSVLFNIKLGAPAYCIKVDGYYSAFSWERTYDYFPKCPTGCYDTNEAYASGLPAPP